MKKDFFNNVQKKIGTGQASLNSSGAAMSGDPGR